MPRKAQSPKYKALSATLRRLRLRYTACINMKNRWANKAEQTAWAVTELQTTIHQWKKENQA